MRISIRKTGFLCGDEERGTGVGALAQVNEGFFYFIFIRFIVFIGAVLRVAMEIRCSHYKSCSDSTSRQMSADVFRHTFPIQTHQD